MEPRASVLATPRDGAVDSPDRPRRDCNWWRLPVSSCILLVNMSEPRLPQPALVPATRRLLGGRWASRPLGRSRQALIAFMIYLLISVLLFGVPLFPHFTSTSLSFSDRDPKFFIWALVWWPHAVAHGMIPFRSTAVWAPANYNMAWTTGVPGPSLVVSPITAAMGPVAAYNVVALLAAPLSGWSTYLLCRRVVDSFWCSAAGGFFFGFSTYLVAQLRSHMNLYLVFLVPLSAYLFVRRIDGSLSARMFVALLTLALTFQFLTSTEIFATMTMMGALGVALWFPLADAEIRRRLLRTLGLVAVAYAFTTMIVSPYLYYAFAYGYQTARVHPKGIDVLNLVIPTRVTAIGGGWFHAIAARFESNDAERGGYVGIPILMLVGLFVIGAWRSRLGRVLLGFFSGGLIVAMGTTLLAQGHRTLTLPWQFLSKLPILGFVQPLRFMLYVWLAVAIMVAVTLRSGGGRWLAARWCLVVLAAVAVLPNVFAGYWHTRLIQPAFFQDGAYREALRSGEIIVLVDTLGDSMLFQAQSHMYYRMAGGYTGYLHPCGFQGRALAYRLAGGKVGPQDINRVQMFLEEHDVAAIVLTPRGIRVGLSMVRLLRAMRLPGRTVDGTLVYSVPGIHSDRAPPTLQHC